MQRIMLKSKIHRATVTQTELHYEGSISIDEDLLEQADILPGEKVEVLNLNNGNRLETYAIRSPRKSGTICLNGPSARSACPGDLIIIVSYAMVEESKTTDFKAKIVKVDERNRIKN